MWFHLFIYLYMHLFNINCSIFYHNRLVQVSVLSCEHNCTTTQHYNAFQCFIVIAMKTHCNKADLILYFNIVIIEVEACILIKCVFLPISVWCSLYVTLYKSARSNFCARCLSGERDTHNQWLVLQSLPLMHIQRL